MIFTERTITVQKGASSIDEPIILYRGDKEAEIRFALNEKVPFKFGSGTDSNMIEKTEAAYGQLIIKTPNGLPSIFSDVTPTNRGKIVFKISAEMIDEVTEIGSYTFQIRLLDENKESRVTIPEVVNGIEIREPIAIEETSTTNDSNEVNVAKVNEAITTTATSLSAFDEQGNYIETTWTDKMLITDAKLNKIEDGITGVNQKADSVATLIPTKTSQLTNDSNFATNTSVDEKIANIEISGGSMGFPTFLQGKKYIAEGDSIVEMQGTTTDKKTFAVTDLQGKDHTGEVRKGYIQEIEKRYGLVCTNTGAGGATIVSKYAELYSINYSDVALVTIAFGVNDARTGIPLGTVNSTDTTTFAGCLNNLLKKIYIDNPECRVLVLTPLQRLFVSDFGIATQNANGNYLIDFVDMCKKVANKRSTKCIDMYRESGLNQTTLYYYTQEGVHPLNEGYKRMSNLIISELDNMFKLEFNPFGTMTNVGNTEPDEPDTGGGGEEPPTEEPTGTVVDISELFINTGKNIDGWGTGENNPDYKYAKYHPLTGKSYTIITYAPLALLDDSGRRMFSYSILDENGTIKSGNYMPNNWGFAQDENDRETINSTEYVKVKATFTVPSTIDENLVVNIPCATDCIGNFTMSYM